MILSKVCMLCLLATAYTVVIAQARLIEIHTADEKMTGLNDFQDDSLIHEPMEKSALHNFLLNKFVRISKTFWPRIEESYLIKSLRRRPHGNVHKKPKSKNHPEDTNHHNKENHPSTESPQHKDTSPKEENHTPQDIEHSNDAKHSKDTKSSEHKNTPKEENPSNKKTDPNASGHGASNANHLHTEGDYDSHYPLFDRFVNGLNNDDGDEEDEEPKRDEQNDENEPPETTTLADERSPPTRENSTTNKISLKKQSLGVVSLKNKKLTSNIIDEDSSANTDKDHYFPETRFVDEKSVTDKNSFTERVS